jgi:hypothetical protein
MNKQLHNSCFEQALILILLTVSKFMRSKVLMQIPIQVSPKAMNCESKSQAFSVASALAWLLSSGCLFADKAQSQKFRI